MTTKKDELKNTLATRANTGVEEKPKTPAKNVEHYLEKMMPAMSEVLPTHLNAERLSRIAMNVIRTNPLLLKCNIPSLMGCVLESAKLGLEPGLLGQSYILPFKNYKASKAAGYDVYDAQFIIGYKGLIDLVRRSGQVSTINARAVHENDEFSFSYGVDDELIHKPTLNDRGAVIAYYAVAKMKDGGYSFQVMSRVDVEKHRDKYSKAKEYGPWKDEFDAMARKTVLHQLINYLPISVEFLSNDERNGVQTHNEYADHKEVVEFDLGTGEIIDAQPMGGIEQ